MTGSHLKTYLYRGLEPDFASVVRAPRVLLLDLICTGIQLYVLFGPYLCFISFYLMFIC